MTANQTHLDETEARIKEFEAELEPERLREAYMALENVSPDEEHDPAVYDDVRASALSRGCACSGSSIAASTRRSIPTRPWSAS